MMAKSFSAGRQDHKVLTVKSTPCREFLADSMPVRCFGLRALSHLLFYGATISCIYSRFCTKKVLSLLWWLPKPHVPHAESRPQSTATPPH